MNIGVIFCSCAGQIGENLFFDELKTLILREADWIEQFELACSEENRREIINLLKNRKPAGLIILTCSPHNKGNFFQELVREADINPYMVNIVNIREHVVWVTKDKKSATLKAYALFKGALERLKKQKPLFDMEIPISTDILIIGGGLAGINAALILSRAGKRVYLVEKESSLGGKVVRYEKLFPDLSCAPCVVHPMVEEVLNSSIDLRLNSEIKELKGYFGNIYATVFTRPMYVDPKKCIGCSACEDVCPVGAIKVEPMRLPAIAKIQTDRCLYFKGESCDLCIKECPVNGAINFYESEREEDIQIGAVLLSTGFKLMDCKGIPQLGYGKYRDIYNSLEFEELLNIEGPSKGEILTEKGEIPETIGIIHCVGSLDERYNSYCSKICCQYAFKFNRILRQNLPETKIIHFVKEIVLPGKKAHELYSKAKKDPMVKIVRYEDIVDLEVEKEDSLSVKHKNESHSLDIVVLCPAVISETIPFKEISGVFLTGSIKEAMSVEETITDAMSIAGKILSELHGGLITKLPTIAKIDYNKCTGCGICVLQCPYRAIDIEMKKIKLTENLCEGCGICVASCPAKAIELEGFTFEQIISEIEGILCVIRRF
ncbi:MAG: 4Fe-4S binding protein [Thermodesulfovibrio sp.]|nr:4Fe-4S binding protein [Thermodesulfovibrio sp.]